MNTSVLKQKIQALGLYPRLHKETLTKLEDLLPRLGPWDLVRMNPYRMARDHGFQEESLLDVMIHGVKVGLLDFHYAQICPGCGGVEHTHSSLDGIKEETVECTVCARQVESSMDDMVEVSFFPSQALGVEVPNPLENAQAYRDFYHSQNMDLGVQRLALIEKHRRGFMALPPDEDGRLSLTLNPGVLRLLNFEAHTQVRITAEGPVSAVDQVVDLDLLPGGFSPAELTLNPGPVTFVVHNRFKNPVGVVALEAYTWLMNPPVVWHRFLTGKDLLNHQSFRELFRIQQWAPGMKLKIHNLTVLFTDLKGSTDMYSRVGDYNAYSVVQRHFEVLTDIVRRNHGAIVKTMGDAIMATFSHSRDGVQAALEMVQQMGQFQSQGTELGLKIGIHEGPALAVNSDDRLDYFGQNINLAARVQGLADSGEIWITGPVKTSPGVEDLLGALPLKIEPKRATLKGISGTTEVFRLVSA